MADDRFHMQNWPVRSGHIDPVYVTGGRLATEPEGSEGEKFKQDLTDALVIISYPHHEVHAGSMFEVTYKAPDGAPLADDATIAFLLRTGAKFDHLVFGTNAGGDAELELLEAPTITDDGAALAELNMNRGSVKVAVTVVTLNPTVTVATGTLLFNDFVPGGSGGNAQGGSGAVRQGTEWILAPNTAYVIRMTNRAGNAQPGALLAQWYEESINS